MCCCILTEALGMFHSNSVLWRGSPRKKGFDFSLKAGLVHMNVIMSSVLYTKRVLRSLALVLYLNIVC